MITNDQVISSNVFFYIWRLTNLLEPVLGFICFQRKYSLFIHRNFHSEKQMYVLTLLNFLLKKKKLFQGKLFVRLYLLMDTEWAQDSVWSLSRLSVWTVSPYRTSLSFSDIQLTYLRNICRIKCLIILFYLNLTTLFFFPPLDVCGKEVSQFTKESHISAHGQRFPGSHQRIPCEGEPVQ